jgi:hypothetical protein
VAVVSLVAFGAPLLGIYVTSRRCAPDIDRRQLSVKRVQSGVLNVRSGG